MAEFRLRVLQKLGIQSIGRKQRERKSVFLQPFPLVAGNETSILAAEDRVQLLTTLSPSFSLGLAPKPLCKVQVHPDFDLLSRILDDEIFKTLRLELLEECTSKACAFNNQCLEGALSSLQE